MILIFNFQANDERMRSESDYFQIKYCENCLYMNRIHWAKILFCCFISLSKDKMCRKGVECRAAASAGAGGRLLSASWVRIRHSRGCAQSESAVFVCIYFYLSTAPTLATRRCLATRAAAGRAPATAQHICLISSSIDLSSFGPSTYGFHSNEWK